MSAPKNKFQLYDPKGKYRRVERIVDIVRKGIGDCKNSAEDDLKVEELTLNFSELDATRKLDQLNTFLEVEWRKTTQNVITQFGCDINTNEIVDKNKVLPCTEKRLQLAIPHVIRIFELVCTRVVRDSTLFLINQKKWTSLEALKFFYRNELKLDREFAGTMWAAKHEFNNSMLEHILQTKLAIIQNEIFDGIINSQTQLTYGHRLQRALQGEAGKSRVKQRLFFQERLPELRDRLFQITPENIGEICKYKTKAFVGAKIYAGIPSKIEKIYFNKYPPDANSKGRRKEVPLDDKQIQAKEETDLLDEIKSLLDRKIDENGERKLSPKLRKTFDLKVIGLTLAENAQEQGISIEAAKKRLFRARERLKR